MSDETRAFGFTWHPEPEVYTVDWQTHVREYGEFSWSSVEDSFHGGTYYVIHRDEDGLFDVIEMGGAGPNVWDRPVALGLDSPLAAMREAKRAETAAEAEYDAFERYYEDHVLAGRR